MVNTFLTMATTSFVFLQFLYIVSNSAYDQLVKPDTTIATTSSKYLQHDASLAVDGNFHQDIDHCSHTDAKSTITEAWLQIDLNRTYSLKSVKFWYRSSDIGTKRLPGYSIRVSNDSTLPKPESICYQDRSQTIQEVIIEKDCERTAQYVWIYQNNTLDDPCPMLEICEVQIFGCEVGTFGENCSKTCDHCYNSDHCGIVSGKCDESGCANKNFYPPMCEECVPGMYGDGCEESCNANCRNKTCDRNLGTCSNGCERGYNGSHCDQICPSGNHGYDCKEDCGRCLKRQACNHVDGYCPGGCDEGFKGKLCNISCSPGEYGTDCMFNCSGNCLNNVVCDQYSGNCDNCSSGYEGPKCDKQCSNGLYGLECSLNCGNCAKSTYCHHVNGTCAFGCAPGWKHSEECVIPCDNGTYGMNCMYNCTAVCANGEFCDKTDGSCPGCSPDTGCDAKSDEQAGDSPNVGVIAGSLSAVVAFVAVITTASVLILLRRKRENGDKGQVRMSKLEQNEECYDEDESNHDDNVYYNSPKSISKSINIADFAGIIQVMDTAKKGSFKNEFNMIPYGEQPSIPCTIGKLPENILKNRFKTTFPYDHSRIVLQSTQNADYINANYIKNTRGEMVYIASQGPRVNTVNDFWQMVWQENILVIAMVTNLTEGSTIKCERYWPDKDTEKMVRGKFSIKLLSQKTYANFATHQLKVINKETRTTRQLLHLQYTTWPDHGTPNPLELLVFYQYVSRAMDKYPNNKLLVHCSAGIGRTGTFIALDSLHREGMREGQINIVEYVKTMREDRMNMIQNANQYQFLYHVLHESFRGKGQSLPRDKFITEIEGQMSSNKAVNQSRFRKEFMELDVIRPVFGDHEQKFCRQNLSLNMTPSVLPADKIRIILSSHVPGRSTYVNAVPLSTFTIKDCLIAAQYPVPGAAVDLIRLLIDRECSTLVSLNPLSKVPSSKEWVPSAAAETVSLMKYKVKAVTKIKLSENVCKSTVKMQKESDDEWHNLHIYEVTTWDIQDTLPSSTDVMLDLVKSVSREETIDTQHKMTVLSRDGATGCGVFCAVYNAIQQLQQDEEVDMFTIVRQLQSRRPEMITNLNEYIFSCQAVAQYIKSEPEDMYMNPDVKPEVTDENIYANT